MVLLTNIVVKFINRQVVALLCHPGTDKRDPVIQPPGGMFAGRYSPPRTFATPNLWFSI